MGRPIDIELKDVSHPFMTMILTCVIMVGLADVPDIDRGDFRPRRAIDISRLFNFLLRNLEIILLFQLFYHTKMM